MLTEDRDDAEAKAEAEKPRPPKSLCHHLSRHGPAARRRRGGVERQAPGGHKARQSPKCSELMWLGSPELTSAGSTSSSCQHACIIAAGLWVVIVLDHARVITLGALSLRELKSSLEPSSS